MRAFVIWTALLLLVGAGVLELLGSDSGYVLISLWQTRIEMSFWMALGVVSLTLFSIWLVIKVLTMLLASSNTVLGRWLSSGGRRAASLTAEGLVDFMEGNWKQARKRLLRSAAKSQMPLLNYLAAARSTYELGDHEEAFELLHKAEQAGPKHELAVALTQARMQLLDKKYEQCLATLERARRVSPSHPVVLDLLRQTYEAVADCEKLLALLPELKKHKVVSSEQEEQLEVAIYGDLLSQALDIDVLKAIWKKMSSGLRKQAALVEVYAKGLQRFDADSDAEVILRSALEKRWDESLLIPYSLVEGRDKAKQLLCAESWLKERPSNATLMLVVGRLCLRNELWGRARQYFENSLQLQKDPHTFAELARLLAHLGEHEKSTGYYQQGLLMMTEGLPDLPMPD